MLETDRLPVDEDHVDLGMGDAERFDEVFDRACAPEPVNKALFAALPGQKIVELLVEPKLDFDGVHRCRLPNPPVAEHSLDRE